MERKKAGPDKESFVRQLSDAIFAMEVGQAEKLARQIVAAGWFSFDIIERGIVHGMRRASCSYEQGEYFIPELLVCADAAEAATCVFRPCMKNMMHQSKGRVVIGSIRGDTHDIGKNIVALVISSAGYDVLDLGRDVPEEKFIDSAESFQADIIAVASLMTTSMPNIAGVTGLLEERGLRQKYAVMVGGKPLSIGFARRIGADFYAENAGCAVRCVEKIMQQKKENGC